VTTEPTESQLPESATWSAFRHWLTDWLHADGMQQLVKASGWRTRSKDADGLLDELVEMSSAWEFRSGAERHRITDRAAQVGNGVLDEAFVRSCAAALGLVGGEPVTGSFLAGVALGGMARACLRRLELLSNIDRETSVTNLAILTAHRPLQGSESSDALELGWGNLKLESEAALAAAKRVFALSTAEVKLVQYGKNGESATLNSESSSASEYRRRSAWSIWHWEVPRHFDVVAAPSGRPDIRRANTADQLEFWASRCRLEWGARVLLVTTEHYVPYQHLQALRVLGIPLQCRIVTTGTPWKVSGQYMAAGYLQEIRSTLQAAQQLRDALRGSRLRDH
jgi:hypothetical protein